MRRATLFLILMTSAAAARVPLAAFGRWGAFREGNRCFAMAAPLGGRRNAHAAAAFVLAPGVRPQLHVRLSRIPRADRPVRLVLGSRDIALAVQGEEAWPLDPRDDARLVAAARSAERMAVTGYDDRTRRFRDVYPLSGAASAIDAAAVACLAR